jgi:predicted ATPase
MFVLQGSHGAGKSRLLTEFLKAARVTYPNVRAVL